MSINSISTSVSQDNSDSHIKLSDVVKGWWKAGMCPLPTNDLKKSRVFWKAYQTEQPTAEDICYWASTWKGTNWCVLTGARPASPKTPFDVSANPGIVVVDADAKIPGAVQWVYDNLPQSELVCKTQSGGEHHYYRHPGGNLRIKNGVRVGTAAMVDIRGDGGYPLLPGSVGTVGRYRPIKGNWAEPLADILKCPVFDPAWFPGWANFERKVHEVDWDGGDDAEPDDDADLSTPWGTFDAVADWDQHVMSPAGWTYVGGNKWRRPNGDSPHHAGLVPGTNLLHVFSGEGGLETERTYGPFNAYVALHHDGDRTEAVRAVLAMPLVQMNMTGSGTAKYDDDVDELFGGTTTSTTPIGTTGTAVLSASIGGEIIQDDEPILEPLDAETQRIAPEPEPEVDLVREFSKQPVGNIQGPGETMGGFLRRYSAVRASAKANPPKWVIPWWLELGKLHIFSGAPFSGKSTVLADIIATVVNGGEWCGKPLLSVPILLADHENGDRIIVKRVDRALDHHGGDGDVENLLHVVDVDKRTGPMTVEFATQLVVEFYRANGFDTSDVPDDAPRGVLILDTMRSSFAGHEDYEENDNSAMASLLQPWRQWARRTGWAVFVLHHNNKGGGFAGATAIMSTSDIAWSWESSKVEMTGKLTMHGSTDDHQYPLSFRFDMLNQRNVYVPGGPGDADTPKVDARAITEADLLPILSVLRSDEPMKVGVVTTLVKGKEATVRRYLRHAAVEGLASRGADKVEQYTLSVKGGELVTSTTTPKQVVEEVVEDENL